MKKIYKKKFLEWADKKSTLDKNQYLITIVKWDLNL